MHVTPATNLRILKNVPLNNTYRDTIYFSTKLSQTNYFTNLAVYTFNDFTYQRQNRAIYVPLNAELLYNCNYIMFQNVTFGNKWFYAFVTEINYINNETTEILWELDVMQTWHFDYTLHACFVEREHSITDKIGENTIEENLELGEYVYSDFDASGYLSQTCIVAACTFDKNLDDSVGGTYGGLYSGLCYNVFYSADDINQFIDRAVRASKATGIINIFIMPTELVGEKGSAPRSHTITKTKKYFDISGYQPKNNKLFTFPYNFLTVTNLEGNAAAYRYEDFEGTTCQFLITGSMSCTPQALIAPLKYKGIAVNYVEKMVMSSWPQCAYSTDTFKAYIAQNATNLAVEGLSTAYTLGGTGAVAATSTAAGVPDPTAIAGFGNALIDVTKTVARIYQTSLLPPQAHGAAGGDINAAISLKDFAFCHTMIKAEYAKIIDDYFNVYGYATKRVKVPNRFGRPHWCYTKTIGCNITGNAPAPDIKTIRQIYDKGITFWQKGGEIGNYGLDNRVGGGET